MSHRQEVHDLSPSSRPTGDSSEIQSIEQIAATHQGEWVLIADCETDEALEVLSGRVIGHDADRDALMRTLVEIRPADFAVYYFGTPPADLELML